MVVIWVKSGGLLSTNCYVLISSGEAVIVDPGWVGVGSGVLSHLRDEGVKVRAIVVTHLHFDHMLGVRELVEATGAELVVGRVEFYGASRFTGVVVENLGIELFPPLGVEPSILVSEGDVVEFGGVELRVLEAPGHSPGSIVLEGPGFTLTGDVVFKRSIGRVDLPGSDPRAMEETLDKIARSIPPDHRILPGHGPPTFMSEELARNPFLAKRKGDKHGSAGHL